MARAKRLCNVCRQTVPNGQSRCLTCDIAADRARGTSTERGYNSRGHQAFRHAVLARDPICVLCRKAYSTVADHYPTSRRDLQADGLNPNNPTYGRGLCAACHNRETATHQPGGWHAHTYDE